VLFAASAVVKATPAKLVSTLFRDKKLVDDVCDESAGRCKGMLMASNLYRTACALLAASFAPWANAAQPVCYPDIPSYMLAVYGPSFKDDDNLLVKEKRYGSVTFTMATDRTTGTNIVRTLLRQSDRDGHCIVLTTIPAIELKVARTDKTGVPLAFLTSDQAPGAQPGNEITYTLGKGNIYTPTSCKQVMYKGAKIIKRRVPCPPGP
jgi:hypothetical protein